MIDKELLRQMHYHITQNFDFLHDLSDTEIESLIEEEVFKLGNQIYISFEDKINYKRQLFNSIRGLDVLQEYIDDEDISEIMVIGTSNIFIERNGTIIETNTHFDSVDKLQNVVQQIAGFSNRRVNEASPIVDSRLPDGSRVNIVLPPVALDGAVITIRKFPKYHMTMNDLIELGSISRPAANFLEQLVLALTFPLCLYLITYSTTEITWLFHIYGNRRKQIMRVFNRRELLTIHYVITYFLYR